MCKAFSFLPRAIVYLIYNTNKYLSEVYCAQNKYAYCEGQASLEKEFLHAM